MRRLVILGLLFATAAFGQYDTASVLGTVTDPSSAVVSNVKVTLENVKTGVKQTAVTDLHGDYLFLNQRIGDYRVIGEAPGFKQMSSDVFTLTVNARQRVNLVLQVGEITQSIAVTGAVEALETDSSDRGQVIQRGAIVNLPLNGRAYADLALLSPGVRKSNITARDASFNVNGLRSSLNNFMLDGVDNNAYGTSNQGFSNQIVQLNPDAVEEFRVVTNNFSAEYGRAGGAVINASLRSGTNEFHGSVWEFMRNTKLNAVGFFKPASGVKPVLVQNQFGASMGGPIRKDKTFFFADYEGLRRVSRTLEYATIPTPEQRQGKIGIPIANPITGGVYTNGIVPASEITAFATQVLNDLPAPIRSTAGGTMPSNNWEYLTPTPSVDNKGNGRIDHYFSSHLNAFVRYSHRLLNRTENSKIPGNSGGDANGHVRVYNQQIATGFNYNLSPTSLIDFRLGVSVFEGGKSALGKERANMKDLYGITGLPDSTVIGGGLTNQSVSGFTAFGRQSSNPQFQNPTSVNPKVNYSKIMGRHSLKMGYEYQAINTDIFDFNPQYGQDSYSGKFSRPSGASSNNLFNLVDFMYGARSSYNLNNEIVLNYRPRMNFFYLQDDWKVSTKLTLNLGVRYEYATPQWEDKNRLANFDSSAKSLIYAKDGGVYDRTLVHPDRNNWAPRIGLAYQVTPKTVVRSGYGVSYIHFNRLGGENLLGYNGPSVVNVTMDQTPKMGLCSGDAYSNCFRLTQQGYPSGLVDPANFSTVNTRTNYTPSDYRTSYVQSWHLTIQREIAKDLIFDIAYVGNRSNGLMILTDYNQARANNAGESLTIQQRRPLSGFGFIQMSYGGGFAKYHALQTKLEKRYASGVYILNSFTWSKTIDNASGHLEAYNGDNSRVNFANVAAEKAVGAYDQPFNNTTSVVWEVPYGKGRHWGSGAPVFMNAVFGGWRLTGINTMTSGQPINIKYSPSSTVQVSSVPTYRPDYVGGSIYSDEKSVTNYFNKAAFAAPATTQPFGNLGRNIARTESMFNFDLAMHKEFPLWWESGRLQFRSEFFNLFNVTNLGAANQDFSSSNFGKITGLSGEARQIQFAMKLVF